MKMKLDVVIMATKKNLKTLKKSIPYIKKNIKHDAIYIVSSKNNQTEITDIKDVTFVDEDSVVSGMTFAAVADIMEELTGSKSRTGWYFQQFLKLGWAQRATGKYYVVIDADTFPLNQIDFVSEDERYEFTSKIEYNKPYFDTIDQLFHGRYKRVGDFSFVAEHMAFDVSIVKQMLKEIECCNPLKGNNFYEIILRSVNTADLPIAGFSEFETYGTYISINYPELVQMRKLRTLREAAYVLGGEPTKEQLEWAAQDYDIISIEVPEYSDKIFTRLTRNSFVQKHIHLSTIAKTRQNLRSVYRKMVGKKDMRFD